jgi:hypothetical protein
VTLAGTDADEDARRVLRRHIAVVRFCYERAWQSDPLLAGTLTLVVDVDEAGRVAAVRATGMDAVAACAEQVARRWVFPPSEHAHRLSVGYNLSH